MGQDTVYDATLDDVELLQRALAENRILLSRDRQLSRRQLARSCLLIESDDWREQLRQVVTAFGLASEVAANSRYFSRCVECNGVPEPADRSVVQFQVPAHIYESHREFRKCPACNRVYWRGSHVEAAEAALADLL